MDPVTGAVVMVGLGTVGKPTARVVADFLGRILGPTGDVVGEALAHPIVEWQRRRVERAQDVLDRAARQLEEQGHEPRPVPGRVLMPILDAASLEENESLRETWTNLLARAASSHLDEVLPAFPAMLSRLSPQEVEVLSVMFESAMEVGEDYPFLFIDLVASGGLESEWADIYSGNFIALGICRYGPPELTTADLERLSSGVRFNETARAKGGHRTWNEQVELDSPYLRIPFTALGLEFLRACRPLDPASGRVGPDSASEAEDDRRNS